MTGSQTDDGGLLSDIPPADDRKSLADFLKPRSSSRPPSLADFLRPSAGPRSGLPSDSPVRPSRTPERPSTIQLPDPEPPPRASLFSELPVPRSPRVTNIPRAPALPGDGARRDAPQRAPGASTSTDEALDAAAHSHHAPLVLADQADLDAELTSTRRWLEARRSSQAGLPPAVAEPALRHTAEPVWNANLPHGEPEITAEEGHVEHESLAGLHGWRTPGARRTIAAAIVVGAALLTLVVRSSVGHRPPVEPGPRALAVEPVVPAVDNIIPPPSEAIDDAVPPLDAATLRREARQLLTAGKVREGVRLARQLIELDPRDSEAYVLLAAGLQDLGRWRESQELFEKCAHLTSGADTAECVYFARRAQ